MGCVDEVVLLGSFGLSIYYMKNEEKNTGAPIELHFHCIIYVYVHICIRARFINTIAILYVVSTFYLWSLLVTSTIENTTV